MRPLYAVGLLALSSMATPGILFATDRVFAVATDATVVNHWPGPDGFLGTADDVVNNGKSRFLESSPNVDGSYGYLATSLLGVTDDWLPGKNDTVTYLSGTVTLDPTTLQAGDIPTLKALEFEGTELFPGHGPYSIKLTRPHD